jgi:iron complex transport system substrate-binding protein
MKKFKNLVAVVAVASLAFVGCQSNSAPAVTETAAVETNVEEPAAQAQEAPVEALSPTITISHQYGDVEVPRNPKSVTVADIGVLDALDKLGVEVIAGIPKGNAATIPDYLKQYLGDDYTDIGTLHEPDYETLFELAPEIIFISGRQGSHYEELSKIAPVVFMSVDNNDYFASVEMNLSLLGEVFGKEEEAASVLTDIKAGAEQVKTAVEAEGFNALVVMVSKGELSVYGAGSRFGSIYSNFGFAEAVENIEEATHGQVITFEYLAEVNPDYLFVMDRNAITGESETAKDVLDNPIVAAMDAAKSDRIAYLDPVAWYITPGGASSSAIMVENVKTGLGLE